jgi:Uma2 family endonuclease
MPPTTSAPSAPKAVTPPQADQQVVVRSLPWDAYIAIGDAFDSHREVRVVYQGGTLTLMVKSREHELFAERLGYFVAMIAVALCRPCEPCGRMTLRRRDVDAGVEGDKTFYLGPNATRMRGVKEVDLEVDPPPDLAVEVELTHAADEAVATYARLGVPEVWRFDAKRYALTFLRLEDGYYVESPVSAAFPELAPPRAVEQLRVAGDVGTTQWLAGLVDWARAALRA